MNIASIAFKIAAAASIVALVACGASGSSGFVQSENSAAAPHATITVVPFGWAGQYSGTVTDSVHGTGKATINITQSGSSIGGTMVETFGTSATTDVVALTASGNQTAGGSAIAPLKKVCSLQIVALRNLKTFVLSGSYSAFHNCGGESGTFSAKEQCYYVSSQYTTIGVPALRPHPFKFLPC